MGKWAGNNALAIFLSLMAVVVLVPAVLFNRGFSALFVGAPVGLVVASPLIVYAYSRAARRREIQRVSAEASADAGSSLRPFPVRYCSNKRFWSIWKFFPWEATGVLVPGPAGVTLTTRADGRTTEVHYDTERATLDWVGCVVWPNGALFWFSIEQDGTRTYFTSETGGTVFGSKNSTRKIFEDLAVRAG